LASLLLAAAVRRRRRMRHALGMLPLLAVAVFLLAVERPPFERDNPSYELYTRLDERLGLAGWVWNRAINGQAAILRLTYDVPGLDVVVRPRPV
jgi:peptidoglycan/LPS O-acetylase OafA/YrhL